MVGVGLKIFMNHGDCIVILKLLFGYELAIELLVESVYDFDFKLIMYGVSVGVFGS